ncbi:MAG: type II secretion system GspH family protein, partial [Clostridia bacterium]|nr:type II secretion system GspH family protein [Clostridia bacterium]
AKLDAARKNKKGFSLVELIIVMAIMVALIAVLAPQFVKYVQRARDSSVSDAAENVYEMVKSEYALGNLTGTGTVTVQAGSSSAGGRIQVVNGGLTTAGDYGDNNFDAFVANCGLDTKEVNSHVYYIITVGGTVTAPTFTMEKYTAA